MLRFQTKTHCLLFCFIMLLQACDWPIKFTWLEVTRHSEVSFTPLVMVIYKVACNSSTFIKCSTHADQWIIHSKSPLTPVPWLLHTQCLLQFFKVNFSISIDCWWILLPLFWILIKRKNPIICMYKYRY